MKLLLIKIFQKKLDTKLTLTLSKLSPKIYNNNSGLTTNNGIVIEDRNNANVNDLDLTTLQSRFTSLENKTDGIFIENNGIEFEFVDPSESEKKIIIPYGTIIPENFFSNSDTYLLISPKYLFTYSSIGNPISTLSSLFNFFNDGENTFAGVRAINRDNNDILLTLNKNDGTAQLGSCNNFENEVNVGGKKLNLYTQDHISIRHASSTNTYCQFRCESNNLHFTNHLTPSKTVIIPNGFNTSIHTIIQHDTIAEKDVNVLNIFKLILQIQ
jgi:hypothetical protein